MRVRFWGTRGSIPKPGPSTVRFGGNTSCVEVRTGTGSLVVLDCGTGAHALGHALVAARTRPLRGHLLITHTHWDHIQGFPFFAPFFQAGDEWDVYAPRGLRESLRETLAGQMQYTYFPVTPEQFAATVRYHDLVEGEFSLDDVRVTTRYLNHPALTLGYRLEADGVRLVYATDHEPHSRALAEGTATELAGEDVRHAEFLAGADLVIHDAQYTASEYGAKVGWGHSTIESVLAVTRAAGVRRVALFHHDPHRSDAELAGVVATARNAAGATLEVLCAAEGDTVEVSATPHGRPSPAPSRTAAESRVPIGAFEQPVLLAVEAGTARDRLSAAMDADRLALVVAKDADETLSLIDAAQPALLLLGRRLGGVDGFQLARAARGRAAELPIVMVAASEAEVDREAGAAAGVTDWLVAPFSTLYARTRIRAWAMRQACRWIGAPLPPDEPARLRALDALGLLDTPPEERFDRLTRLARRVFDVPMALVTLVDAERQWFKSRQGVELAETPREAAFCAYTIHGDEPFVVPDALGDPRFADNPIVSGALRVRFYAGYPVRIGRHRVGTLCLGDRRPRDFSDDDRRTLEDLSALVEHELRRGAS
jgi:phosphoribosyl 1,2-cyclic phosphodiesterase/DNA-binding response OmpR family regulator